MTVTSEKALYSLPEVLDMVGIGRTKLYQELNSGRLVAVKIGKRTCVAKPSLEAWLSTLQGYQSEKSQAVKNDR